MPGPAAKARAPLPEPVEGNGSFDGFDGFDGFDRLSRRRLGSL